MTRREKTLAGVILAIGGFAALFRVERISGELVPAFALRSSPRRDQLIDLPTPAGPYADRQSRALLDAAAPPAGGGFEVVNTLSWARGGVVMLPASATAGRDRVVDAGGQAIPL